MNRLLKTLFIGILAVMTVQGTMITQASASSDQKKHDIQFEVLSPWADTDPIPFRGISPRLDGLAGKKSDYSLIQNGPPCPSPNP